MIRLLIHGFLRLVLLVLLFVDYRERHKVLKKDKTMYRVLTKGQKSLIVPFYIIMVIGLIVPFDWIYILVTIFSLAVFFIFTDKEMYLNRRFLYFRGKFFKLDDIKEPSFVNHKLSFTYHDETVTVRYPFMDPNVIEKEIIKRYEKRKRKLKT